MQYSALDYSNSDSDWSEEYLAPIVAIKVVTGLDEAIDHINTFSSKHTESIITEDRARGKDLLLRWIQAR